MTLAERMLKLRMKSLDTDIRSLGTSCTLVRVYRQTLCRKKVVFNMLVSKQLQPFIHVSRLSGFAQPFIKTHAIFILYINNYIKLYGFTIYSTSTIASG